MKIIKIFFALYLVIGINSNIFGSVPPPVASAGPTCWPPPCIPIDNGLIFLIIAGTLYAAKKIYDLRKHSVTQL
jgi:hypothetical protein